MRETQELVNTSSLCNRTSKKHCAGYVRLALRLTADRLQRLCNRITFTDTRTDTCDQRLLVFTVSLQVCF